MEKCYKLFLRAPVVWNRCKGVEQKLIKMWSIRELIFRRKNYPENVEVEMWCDVER